MMPVMVSQPSAAKTDQRDETSDEQDAVIAWLDDVVQSPRALAA